MSIGIWQVLLILVAVILLFGRGKISQVMGDVAKGINSFRKGLKEGAEDVEQAKTLDQSETIDVDPKAKSRSNG